MKNKLIFCLLALLLPLAVIEVSAQSAGPQLDQVKLMKQYVGKWKADTMKDTVITSEYKEFGTGLDGFVHTEVNGKTVAEMRQLFGYDSKAGRYSEAEIAKGSDMELWVCWFTSPTRMVGYSQADAAHPDQAHLWVEIILDPPKSFRQLVHQDGKVIYTKKMVRQ